MLIGTRRADLRSLFPARRRLALASVVRDRVVSAHARPRNPARCRSEIARIETTGPSTASSSASVPCGPGTGFVAWCNCRGGRFRRVRDQDRLFTSAATMPGSRPPEWGAETAHDRPDAPAGDEVERSSAAHGKRYSLTPLADRNGVAALHRDEKRAATTPSADRLIPARLLVLAHKTSRLGGPDVAAAQGLFDRS